MFEVGEKIIYGENGVCTIEEIAPLPMSGSDPSKMYYYLTPYIGTGVYYAPVESNAFMRTVIGAEEAVAFIDSIPGIPAAVCTDNRFNHVDAYYKNLFRLHTNEALVSIIKGMHQRMAGRKARSSRGEATMKHAKDILYGELSCALGIEFDDVENYITNRLGNITEEA